MRKNIEIHFDHMSKSKQPIATFSEELPLLVQNEESYSCDNFVSIVGKNKDFGLFFGKVMNSMYSLKGRDIVSTAEIKIGQNYTPEQQELIRDCFDVYNEFK